VTLAIVLLLRDDGDDDDVTKGSVLALALALALIMNWRLPRSRVIATASLDCHGQEVWSHHRQPPSPLIDGRLIVQYRRSNPSQGQPRRWRWKQKRAGEMAPYVHYRKPKNGREEIVQNSTYGLHQSHCVCQI
jgi:hypothetical protein